MNIFIQLPPPPPVAYTQNLPLSQHTDFTKSCKSQGAIALLLAAVLGFGIGEVHAQTAVCSNTPGPGERIRCTTSDNVDIDIDVKDSTITTDRRIGHGISGRHQGEGKVNIDVKDSEITTYGEDARGIYSLHQDVGAMNINAQGVTITTHGEDAHGVFGWRNQGKGDVNIDVKDSVITTNGKRSSGIYNFHQGEGAMNIDVQGVTITTNREGVKSHGVAGRHYGKGDVNIDVKDSAIMTYGEDAYGIYNLHQGEGVMNIDAQGVTITTNGETAHGVFGWRNRGEGDVNIDVKDSAITTYGRGSYGIHNLHQGEGAMNINAQGVTITTNGESAHGVFGWRRIQGEGDVNIDMKDSAITTNRARSHGIYSNHQGVGAMNTDVKDSAITTNGERSYGIFSWYQGTGTGDVNTDVKDSTITTDGEDSYGILNIHLGEGAMNIDVKDSAITTNRARSHGILGRHLGSSGDVHINAQDIDITTTGNNAHGILGNQMNTGTTGSIDILVNGGTILASGMDASGVQVGRITPGTNAVERAAEVGDDGYRRQSVTVNGQVFGGGGDGAGVFLAGGGKVIIGPKGSVGAESGVAIRAAGQDSPRLHLTLNLGDRRITRVLDDDYIVNDGGQTTILFNGVLLHDGDTGNTGFVAPNGAFDVTLKDKGVTVDRTDPNAWVIAERLAGVVDDRDFSADDFIEVYAPRAAPYEVLPGLLLRLNGREPAAERPRSPIWVRLSGGRGSYEPDQAVVGAEYDYERFELEVGVNHPLGEDLSGSVALRHVQGSGEVSSPAGGGEIDATGIGVSFGAHWSAASGNYLAGLLSLTDYDVEISSDKRGRLKGSGGALGHFLSLEAGRRAAFGERVTLTPRAWLTRSGISMNNFTDKVGSRVSLSESRQLMSGLGVVAETERVGERKFVFRGSLDVGRVLGGARTTVKVSGEKLESESEGTRALLSLGGAYRWSNCALSGEVSAGGLSSDDREYSGQLNLEIRF